jgi:hypothetical protein
MLLGLSETFSLAGCTKTECRDDKPAVEITFRAPVDELARRSMSLEVFVEHEDTVRRRVFPVEDAFSDGVSQLRLEFDDVDLDRYEIKIRAHLYDSVNASGMMLASGEQTLNASANGCNRLDLLLGAVGSPDAEISADIVDAEGAQDAMRTTEEDSATDAGVILDHGFVGVDADSGAILDHGFEDAAAGDADIGSPEAGAPDSSSRCNETVDTDTVALYTFNGSLTLSVLDLSGRHTGQWEERGDVAAVPGPRTCGNARDLHGGYAVIPHSPDFDLMEGAVDFWVKMVGSISQGQGLISRDAQGITFPGHLSITLNMDGYVFARIQIPGSTERYLCSAAPIPTDVWVHIGLNFGGMMATELYVDSSSTTQTGTITGSRSASTITCSSGEIANIVGNMNPWVFGAGSWNSNEGSADPVTDKMDGLIDNVRISSVRRDF